MKIEITLQPDDAVLDGRHLVQLTNIWPVSYTHLTLPTSDLV